MRTILNMKIDATLKEDLRYIAKLKNRTLANLIETVLREFVNRETTEDSRSDRG